MSTHIYRLVVDAWPTPDGRPFTEQDDSFWMDIVYCWANSRKAPDWLPKDFDNYLHGDTDGRSETGGPVKPGKTIYDRFDDGFGPRAVPILNVPSLPRRTFLAGSVAQARLDQLLEWGVTARIDMAPVGEWTPMTEASAGPGKAEVATCGMYTQDPFPFAWCELHDETFPLDDSCPFHPDAKTEAP